MITTDDWWYWAKNLIVKDTRAQRLYNDEPPYGLRGYMPDGCNRMIGYPILRQIRNKRYNCQVPDPMNRLVNHCSGERDLLNEDDKNYCAGWIHNESFHGACKLSEFKHKTASELGTYYTSGKLGYYGGGGYVFGIKHTAKEVSERLELLQKNSWIDQNTRAVILEFATYNPNVNIFVLSSIIAEFNDGGGIVPSWRFQPIRVLKDNSFYGYIITACEVVFIVVTVFFTIREMLKIKKEKLSYFSDHWNVIEIFILASSYACLGLYIHRYNLVEEAIERFAKNHGNVYVRMDSAAFVDLCYHYLIAFIMFCSIVKLIKLLRFNRRMDVLALTIGGCWEELRIFFLAFAIIFFAFSCLFFFMFNQALVEFAHILSAMQTSFKMMMGKFNFEAMNQANWLSPLLFFIFSVMNSMIMINIMLTIILQSFDEIKLYMEKVGNRLNVIDYIWRRFCEFFRQQNLQNVRVSPVLKTKNDGHNSRETENNEVNEELPDKVSTKMQDIFF